MTTRRGTDPPAIETLGDLRPDPKNANVGTSRGKQMINTSLKTYGTGRSILVDRHGTIIAGNKTFEQAKALGLGIKVVDVTGADLVVVRRTNLDLNADAHARELAIADNRTTEADLEWDPAMLDEVVRSGADLTNFWTDQELEQLLGHGLHEGHTPEDAVVPLKETTIVPGDLFALGEHRLLCGDATDAAHVARLFSDMQPVIMVTDPPYGVDYDPEWRVRAGRRGRHATGKVTNDHRVDWQAAFALFPGRVAYVWHAGLHAGAVAHSLTACGFELRAQIIWAKPNFVLGRGDFHWQHEPCWYAVRTGQKSGWCGDRTISTLWTIPNLNPFSGGHEAENAVTGHSTQKPVAVFERALLYNTVTGDIMFDPFIGSGTAVIAAEKTRRRCFGIELEPRYVQATIDRWEAYASKKAIRIDTPVESTQG